MLDYQRLCGFTPKTSQMSPKGNTLCRHGSHAASERLIGRLMTSRQATRPSKGLPWAGTKFDWLARNPQHQAFEATSGAPGQLKCLQPCVGRQSNAWQVCI